MGQSSEMEQQHVGAIHGKRRNDDEAIAVDRSLDQVGQEIDGIVLVVLPVAIRGLDDHHVAVSRRLR